MFKRIANQAKKGGKNALLNKGPKAWQSWSLF
jgi:hypothetical protein